MVQCTGFRNGNFFKCLVAEKMMVQYKKKSRWEIPNGSFDLIV